VDDSSTGMVAGFGIRKARGDEDCALFPNGFRNFRTRDSGLGSEWKMNRQELRAIGHKRGLEILKKKFPRMTRAERRMAMKVVNKSIWQRSGAKALARINESPKPEPLRYNPSVAYREAK
jgi:hypothetical protein